MSTRLMRRGGVYFGLACAVLLALSAACSGGNGAKTPASSDTAEPATRSDARAVELAGLSDKFAASAFEGHYSINSSGGQPLNGYVTIYQDGAGRSRFDIASNEND
jgi:hypothetical protein